METNLEPAAGLPAQPGLSAAWLKYFAAFFMLVDHTEAIFGLMGFVTGPDTTLFYLLRFLGRMAFPNFVFFVAEGCRKTHNFPGYLKRLFVFALIAQLPFSLAFGHLGGSVILTFFLGALGVWCYEQIRATKLFAVLRWLPVLAFAALAEWLQTDYSWFGVLLICVLYLCGAHRRRQLICLAVGLIFFYLLYDPGRMISSWIPAGLSPLDALPQMLPYYAAQWLPYHLLNTLFACMPLALLAFYRGARGRGNKWFFYWFYPGHLLLLFFLRILLS